MPRSRETKTSLQRQIEARFSRPIKQVLIDKLNEYGTVFGAAEALGITEATCQKWMRREGVELRTVAVSSAPVTAQ